MRGLDRFLARHAGLILLLLVPTVAWVLSSGGLLSDDAVPFGDGEHYALRALSLYGFLHSGQWGAFRDELAQPGQSLLPLHYLVFFLVPSSMASVAVYGIVQVVVTCALLAFGIFRLCDALERAEWSPALFLLCVMQNVTLDSSYFYFADTPFLAVVSLALSGQVWAWRQPGWRTSLLSGIGAALPFWVKPANALIFIAIYLTAEFARFVLDKFYPRKPPIGAVKAHFPTWRHGCFALAGFLPLAVLSLACGGLQAIFYLIDANANSGLFATHLECSGLLRLLYFPLCLTFFYQTALLLVVGFMATLVLAWKISRQTKPTSAASFAPFPGHLLIPLLLADTLLGLYFSFGMADKEMRSLLILLPVGWLGIFWVMDKWRVSPATPFLVTVIYSVCATAQVTSNAFGGNSLGSSGYQLQGDWLGRFPPMHAVNPAGAGLTRNLLSSIRQAVPDGGKISVGTEEMFLTSESLTWVEERDSALQGKPQAYEFCNFLTNRGEYSRPALLGSRAILLILHPAFQYSPQVQSASAGLAQFAYKQWMLRDHFAQVIPLMAQENVLLGVLIVLKEPMTSSLFAQALTGTGGVELVDNLSFAGSHPKPLSLRQCWDILWNSKTKPPDE